MSESGKNPSGSTSGHSAHSDDKDNDKHLDNDEGKKDKNSSKHSIKSVEKDDGPGPTSSSTTRVRFEDVDKSSAPTSAPSSASSSGSKMTRKESSTARDRRPTPYPNKGRHKVKSQSSCQETMLQSSELAAERISSSSSLSKSLGQKKSLSLDAIGSSLKLATIKSSTELLGQSSSNNNVAVPKVLDIKGRLFCSKVHPEVGKFQEIVTVCPVVVTTITPTITESQQCLQNEMQQQLISSRSPSKGEVCIHVTKSDDSMDNICRICHDSPSSEKLIKPCLCKGSMGRVHRTCLERWLGESGKGACEICGQEFNTVRVPKYRGIRSMIAWIRTPLNRTDSRNFFFDVACFFILTPLACLSAWLCIVGAQNYSFEQQSKFGHGRHHRPNSKSNESLEARSHRDASNSTWTSVGLLSLTGTLVAAYYIWIFVAFRYHLQVWREWQQRNYIVTIVPLANGDFCYPPHETTSASGQQRAQPNSHSTTPPQANGSDANANSRSGESGSGSPSRRRSPTSNVNDNNANGIDGNRNNLPTSGNDSGICLDSIIDHGAVSRTDSACLLSPNDSEMQIIQQALLDSYSTSPRFIIQPKIISNNNINTINEDVDDAAKINQHQQSNQVMATTNNNNNNE